MYQITRAFVGVLAMASVLALRVPAGQAETPNPGAIVAGELAAIARHLALRPGAALDFTAVSGEYCFNLDLGNGGHMVHYAIDPTTSQEDVIDFVDARPLLAAGIDVDRLPRFPRGLRTMRPGQWYYLPAGEMEPHHGKALPFPVLMRATDVR